MTLEHKKQNLVLIPGFVTNNTILEKPINYLKKFFNIYCIDLPGLGAPGRLNDFSLASYGKYVTEQINELNLDSYILEGVSFGFGVASHVAVDDRCRGIIAFYPYVGADSLNFEKENIMHTDE